MAPNPTTALVDVVRDRAALEELVPAWEDLAREAIEPNPFYEPWMLLPALEHLGGEARVLAVRRSGKLVALLPVERRRYKGLPVAALVPWRHRHCLLCTPLLRAASAADSLAALLAWLRQNAAVVAFEYFPAGGPFHHALGDALQAAGIAAQVLDGYSRPLLRRPADAEAYLAATLSRHERQELRRRERRLAEKGELRHVALGPGDDVARWVDEFLRLEAAGWKGREGSALACSEANRRFAVEIFTAAFRRGRLQLVGLDLGGKAIARCSSLLAGRGAFAFKTTYDEAHARFTPGVIAEIDRIRGLERLQGVDWIDSYTAPGNAVLERLWSDRLAIQSLAFGTHGLGELALACLPLARWLKRRLT